MNQQVNIRRMNAGSRAAVGRGERSERCDGVAALRLSGAPGQDSESPRPPQGALAQSLAVLHHGCPAQPGLCPSCPHPRDSSLLPPPPPRFQLEVLGAFAHFYHI